MNVMIEKIQRRIEAYEASLTYKNSKSSLAQDIELILSELYYLLDWYKRKGKSKDK